VRRHQEQERVEVAAPLAAHPPVQAGRPAGSVAGGDRAQHGPRSDRCPGADGRDHRFVGGPQPVRVLQRDDAAAGEEVGEHHGARRGGDHGAARRRRQVHPAMARAEPVRRLAERGRDRRHR
jgi:hypothetical protein